MINDPMIYYDFYYLSDLIILYFGIEYIYLCIYTFLYKYFCNKLNPFTKDIIHFCNRINSYKQN